MERGLKLEDPFLRNIGHWNRKEYIKALNAFHVEPSQINIITGLTLNSDGKSVVSSFYMLFCNLSRSINSPRLSFLLNNKWTPPPFDGLVPVGIQLSKSYPSFIV